MYEKTAEHAKVVITDYIHSLKGYENYNVVFLMRRRNTMNKVMVVKNFALRGFDDVRQKPQKYIVKLKKVKAAVVIACDAGERIISIMAR